MALFPTSSGSGLTKTSTWTDAVAKAKSYIVVSVGYTNAGYSWEQIFTLPKEIIGATDTYSSQGYYLTSSSYGLTQLKFSSTSCTARCFQGSNTEITPTTSKYYYD